MDKRVEVRCTTEEFERWRVAAGAVPLSRWLRLAADAYVSRRLPSHQMDSLVVPTSYEELSAAAARPGFRPDFKGGSR